MSFHYHPDPRHFIAIVIVLAILGQVRQGYFVSVPGYLYTISWKAYAGKLGLGLIFVPLILGMDRWILDYVQASTSPAIIGPLARLAVLISNNTRFWIVLTSAYFLLLVLRKKSWMQFVFGILLAAAFSGAICHLLKFIFLRARPLAGTSPLSFFNFHAFGVDDNYESMPSGDVALIGGAFLYLLHAGRSWFLKAVFLFFPLITALSRVYENKHWPSDTLVSLFLAFMISHIVWTYTLTKLPQSNSGVKTT